MRQKTWYGWIELAVGILMIFLGVYTFLHPDIALGGMVVFYGIAAIVSGIADIALFISLERRTRFGPVAALVGGILSVIVGILLFLNLWVSILAFTILFPIWFLLHCLIRLMNLGYIRYIAGNLPFWVSLVINILGIVIAVLLLFNPGASAVAIGWSAGAYLVLAGIGGVTVAIAQIVRGHRENSRQHA